MTRADKNSEGNDERRERTITVGLVLFLFALIVRFIATVITTLFNINPESTRDAQAFASTAETIATGLLQGQLLTPGPSSTYDLWGAFISPFWLFPGPSIFYARLGNALLGALAIYNVYVIARYYHTQRAGVIATIPLIFYPSIVGVHTTVLREAIVLFCITMALRLVVVPSKANRSWPIYGISVILVYVAYIHRPANQIIYIVAFGIGFIVYIAKYRHLSKRVIGIITALSPLFIILSWSFIQSGIEYLSRTRDVRGGGRTDYLLTVIPQTLPELAAFSWIGAAYFLYAPFPWMIETIPDLIVSIEGLITMGFTVAALWGVRTLAHKNKPATAALVVGLLLAVVFYGVGTVNFGTGMRHRQMFIWIIFLFGGIGIAEHVQFSGLPKLIESKRTVE